MADEVKVTMGDLREFIGGTLAAYGGEYPQRAADLDLIMERIEARVANIASDYEDVRDSHDALVRELDQLLNGENAAVQASLGDIVTQIRGLITKNDELYRLYQFADEFSYGLFAVAVQGYVNRETMKSSAGKYLAEVCAKWKVQADDNPAIALARLLEKAREQGQAQSMNLPVLRDLWIMSLVVTGGLPRAAAARAVDELLKEQV